MPGRFRLAGVLGLALAVVLAVSCAKISTPTATPGGIPGETLTSHSAVPASWGNLVSVSSVPAYPELAQLWFQATDGTVRYAVVSLRTHEVLNAHVIHRGQEATP